MKYIGIQAQKARNNVYSVVLLALFPLLVAAMLGLGCYLYAQVEGYGERMKMGGEVSFRSDSSYILYHAVVLFESYLPYVIGGVALWFVIAWFANAQIISMATGARPLERKENKRVYNIVENLCMSQGMAMPKINVIRDDSLNAFAAGINKQTYAVTLTTGIINHLDDEELEGVIAHELTHIRNRDVRLIIVSIVFVGIFSMLMQFGINSLRVMTRSQPRKRSSKDGKGAGMIYIIILIVILVSAAGYLFSTIMRFAISRKREYMADAGASEMTKRPWALASALRKIAKDPLVEAIKRKDVAQLFIENPKASARKKGGAFSLFATHPPIEKRIAVLEQFG